MYAMSFTGLKSELLISGYSGLSILNLYRGIVSKSIETSSKTVIMRLGKLMCCADSAGKVQFRDPRTWRVEHSIDAYSGSVSDMDVSGNTVVLCGLSSR
jgi:PAB-dependent poly(A)-specific ribonuclease subunit 2